jgi:hypothetical protein
MMRQQAQREGSVNSMRPPIMVPIFLKTNVRIIQKWNSVLLMGRFFDLKNE